jgi:hypothetical protein
VEDHVSVLLIRENSVIASPTPISVCGNIKGVNLEQPGGSGGRGSLSPSGVNRLDPEKSVAAFPTPVLVCGTIIGVNLEKPACEIGRGSKS